MKKVLSLVLCIMLISTVFSGFAEAKSYTEAQICEELGMLEGEGYGVTEQYLLKRTTRLQAAIMYLRLLGLEDEALEYEEGITFDDANTVYWEGGRRILSYLKNNPDLGWVGMSDGTFAPNQYLTAQEYYKVMLEALGYNEDEDFTWNQVFEFAGLMGLGIAKNVEEFTNNDVAIVTVEVLQVEDIHGEVLIEKLVGQGIVEYEDALEVGLVKSDINDNYQLIFHSSDEDLIVPSDGNSSLVVTITVEDKKTGESVEFDGVIEFKATVGVLELNQVTMVEGQATALINSPSIDTDTVSYLTATVISSTSLTDYSGLTGQLKFTFSPDENYEYSNIVKQSVVSVESNQGDRFFVKYTGVIKADAYKQALIDSVYGINTWEILVKAGTHGGVFIDGQPVYIEDIRQKSNDTLEFILNTDSAGSVAPTTNRISALWDPIIRQAYLQDNTNHIFSMPAEVGDVVYASSPINFIVTDTQKPYIYNVVSINSTKIEIEFSESMAEDALETASRGLNTVNAGTPFVKNMPGHNANILIDGKNIYLINDVNGATDGEKAFAAANNLVLIRDLYVGEFSLEESKDTRNMLYITIEESNYLRMGDHQIQLASLKDWAGLTDINNVTTTQTVDFKVTVD